MAVHTVMKRPRAFVMAYAHVSGRASTLRRTEWAGDPSGQAEASLEAP